MWKYLTRNKIKLDSRHHMAVVAHTLKGLSGIFDYDTSRSATEL